MKKEIIKNLIMTGIVSAMLFTSSVCTFAATTPPASPNSGVSSGISGAGSYRATTSPSEDPAESPEADTDTTSGVTRAVPTAVPVEPEETMSIVSTGTEQNQGAKKGISVGGMILWLIISVIINTVISFWVGNRFYRLAKKDTHLTNEIRALRRDVEEKFLSSVGGFAEPEIDIANSNESYSMSEEGITMPSRRTPEYSAASEDEFRKWESRMNSSSRTSEPREHRISRDEFETVRRKKYQPTREEYVEENDRISGGDTVRSKAKDLLGDIFPFKED